MKIYLSDPNLPVHPSTGLRALGIGRRGPIWPVLGGAPDGDDAGGDDGGDGSDADDDAGGGDDVGDKDGDDGADKLGDPGKQALDRMKARVKAETAKRKAAEAELAAARKPAGDDAPDPEKIRAEAKAEARAEGLRDRALDKVEMKAAKLFADPEDARALLASQVDDFVDDDKIDSDAIDHAIAELLKKKPHLAAAQGGKRFGGSGDGGARKGSSKPDQLTEADLKRMTPHQIVEARKAGKLADLL